MSRLRLPFALTLAALSTLALGAAGCSSGQSPTEPARLDAAAKSASPDAKRHGADDPAGDDHGGRQGAVPTIPPGTGDDHGGRQPSPAPGPAPRPARGQELEGAVTAVDAGAQLLTLAGGRRIALTAQTQWNSRGDLTTLKQVAASVAAASRPGPKRAAPAAPTAPSSPRRSRSRSAGRSGE